MKDKKTWVIGKIRYYENIKYSNDVKNKILFYTLKLHNCDYWKIASVKWYFY